MLLKGPKVPDKLQRLIRNLLLGFVFVTIGFALGKRSGQAPAETERVEKGSKVVVTYLHATFRCVTCNTIEAMAKEVVETQFRDALASGAVEWRTENYQEKEDLAQRYQVVAACVVVARVVNGQETGYRRLDDVWTLMKDPPAFEEYVASAIRELLPQGKDGA
jgi:hypothetical protein